MFTRDGEAQLAAFSRARVLVAFDFDGTLAPIVADRAKARMRARTRRLLRRLCGAAPCVVLSGRARADVERRVRGLGVSAISGNHGADLGARPATWAREVARWREALERSLPRGAGIAIEDKGLSLSIHFRAAPSGARARAAIGRVIAKLDDRARARMRVVEGKRVVNLVPADAPDKGEALRILQRRLRCRRVVFVGDDVTDEAVFARADPRVVLGVRVGRAQRSGARWYLRDQREIDALLERLIALQGST